jgi:hypothetical protein
MATQASLKACHKLGSGLGQAKVRFFHLQVRFEVATPPVQRRKWGLHVKIPTSNLLFSNLWIEVNDLRALTTSDQGTLDK